FRLIKADLGSDAVVIQTRKVRLGVFGWFKKPVYEVIAAVDEDALRPPKLAAAAAAGAPKTLARGAAQPARVASPGYPPAASRPATPTIEPRPARAQAAYAASPRSGALPAAPRPAFKAASPVQTNGPSAPVETPARNGDIEPRGEELSASLKLESSDVALLRE